MGTWVHTEHVQASTDIQTTVDTQDIKTRVTVEAAARLRMAAGARGISVGEVMSELAIEHLPPVPKKLQEQSRV